MLKSYFDLNPSPRVLMGPGPSDVHPRVLRAMATPLLGHLDPEFLVLMNETKELLQYVFQTQNELTLPVDAGPVARDEPLAYVDRQTGRPGHFPVDRDLRIDLVDILAARAAAVRNLKLEIVL